ncbi:hypothetical protein KTO58_10345 [Chitinophaga pendula]|uniref:hypothetical protein n=1 Tax=Chitinophaga TaxID=79328 RepID=UPI000BAE952C|nr:MULTISPECIES: hypothetical protein [Chitinophaga]ASZ12812.1 hypothetical protein CK934_18550 [Chitinophaga sp. MD30]UCJ09563.1 hypothetical protein KTO58_10345 [Chitinophaga pendula]
MSTNEMKKKKIEFPTDVGEFVPIDKCNKWRDKYDEQHQRQRKQEKFVKAYFFGKDKIQHLLDYKNAVGIRIYYGIDVDGDGIEDKKMIIFPVDKHGKDIHIKPFKVKAKLEAADLSEPAESADFSVAKAAPPMEDDPFNGGGMDGGWPCPDHC